MYSQILNFISELIIYALNSVWHNGIYLLISILIAAAISVYMDAEKLRKIFLNKPKSLILGSVGFGALTPLCACGTMAVVLSLLSTTLPWGPIMAFLVSSPLMSPDTFIMMAGFVGVKFAVALALSSVLLGISAGYITHLIENKTNFLDGQLRIAKVSDPKIENVNISSPAICSDNCNKESISINKCCSNANSLVLTADPITIENRLHTLILKLKIRQFGKSLYDLGIKKILPLFIIFVMIAYLITKYVPTEWIINLFSGKHFYSVPLAALIGLPLYVADASVAPLLQLLRDSGASYGAILAFMITGPGTSLGVLGGLSIIMKRKAVLLYVLYILTGAIIAGYTYDLLLF